MTYIAKVVDDEVLSAEPGWAMAVDDRGDMYFLIRASAAVDERAITEAWAVARHLRDHVNEALAQAISAAHRAA